MHFLIKVKKKNQIINSFNLMKLKIRPFKLTLYRLLIILEIHQFNHLMKSSIHKSKSDKTKNQNKAFTKRVCKN
jgi:hypothetical protein